MYNYLNNQKMLFAFNIWDINSAKAVMDAAVTKKSDIILQTSSNIFGLLEKKQLREFVSSYAKDVGIHAWLHLDHCRDIEKIKSAIQFGWDSVMIDASDKTIEENVCITNKVVEYAHERNVLVEAEVGQVKGVEEDIVVTNSGLADKDEIDKFLSEAQVDMLAVAFGNAHGMYNGEPLLNYDLVEYTVQQTDIPFVVHGGSGLSDDTLHKLISIPQVKKINISTDIKLAYRRGVLDAYNNGLLEISGFQAVNIEKSIHDAIVNTTSQKLDLL